jgi:hypothetical protein
MKKQLLTLGLTAILAVPIAQGAFDGTINISGSAGAYGGGPFTINVTGGLNEIIGSPFQSFCLEYNEHISLPGNYNVEVNTMAVRGSGGPNPDPISLATAWLYSQYRAGTLAASVAGYGYGTYVNNSTGNSQLQQAIWWLEQETDGVFANNVANAVSGSEVNFNNYLVSTAVAATMAGSAVNARTIDANGAYGVAVLNLYSGTSTYNQDMLAIAVPEPTTVIAGALLLLPFAASTIRILRKKREV